MEPMTPTGPNRFAATSAGFLTGIGLQILFALFVDAVVGPIPGLVSPQMILWIVILLTPPVLSYMFLRVAPGSVAEAYIKGIQMGALFWFVLVLLSVVA